jgi:hypothetical protein
MADLYAKIRWTQAMKSKVPPNTHYYFHDDVEEYLRTATPAAMENYISQYLPAIKRAIQQHQVGDTQE